MSRKVLVTLGAVCALIPLVTSQPSAVAGDIVLTAADAVHMHGHWSRANDASAAGGVVLTTTDSGWRSVDSAVASPSHYVDFTFIPQPQTRYRVWLRMRAQGGSKFNDSVFVQFSNASDTSNVARYRVGTTEGLLVNRQTCNGCPQLDWGWYNDAYWLTQPTVLSFPGGSQTLRVQTREDGVEIDQIVLSHVTYLSSMPGTRENDATIVTGEPCAPSLPAAGTGLAVPGHIAADAFDNGGAGVAYHDSTPGNAGNIGRNTDVDLRLLSSGAYAVTAITAGEWLNYSVDVATAGDYIVEADVAAAGGGGSMHIDAAGANLTGTMAIPNTGSATLFTTLKRRVTLRAGAQTLKVVFDTKASETASLAALRISAHGPTPFSGATASIPGFVPAAAFDTGGQGISSFDTTAGNAGGQFRSGDVDIFGSEATGYYVGATADGEWLEYGIRVAKTTEYLVHFEVAADVDGASLSARFANAATDALAVPNTGGATAFTTVRALVALTAGEQIMRVAIARGGLSLRAIHIEPAAKTFRVPAGGDLQAVIDGAQPGDTILLEAGATFVGNFVLPAKDGTKFITIRSSASDELLPADDVRITPAFAALLPKLRSPNNLPALATAPFAHHYRLQFIEFLANRNGAGDMMSLGDGGWAQNSLAVVPHNLIVDRVLMRGDASLGQKRAISLHSAHTTIVNSYIADIKAVGQDSQAIGGWNGPGPYVISNNYLEGAGENVMFGGADPSIVDLVPSDIVFTRNHVAKPMSWRGSQWQVKNLFELKSAQRVRIDGNLFENNWLAAQTGYAILLKSENQEGRAPWTVVRDVEFTNNIVRNVSSAINILGRTTRYPSIELSHVVIRNNLFENVSSRSCGGNGRLLLINGGSQIVIDHNTVINDGSSTVYADANATPGFVFTNNVMFDNEWGIMGGNTGEGKSTISRYFPSGDFRGNVIRSTSAWLYPSGNFFPATTADVGFADFAGGDYRLLPTSLYAGAATDGTNVGVNFAALAAAYQAVR
jgi:hypothetical protein